MEFKDKLKQLIDKKGITPYRIGVDTSVSKQSVMKYLAGKSIPNGDALRELSEYFKVSVDYLLDNKVIEITHDGDDSLSEQVDQYTVLLLPISAQAGTLNDFLVSVKDSDTERIISPVKGADFAITVTGDSMSPEYPNGSQILIKKINHNSFIEWGKVYVLDTTNGIVIKIINECKDNFDCLLCTSINPDQERYASFKVPKSDIIGIYRVLLCMSMK